MSKIAGYGGNGEDRPTVSEPPESLYRPDVERARAKERIDALVKRVLGDFQLTLRSLRSEAEKHT